jgi:hypothetical protein
MAQVVMSGINPMMMVTTIRSRRKIAAVVLRISSLTLHHLAVVEVAVRVMNRK